MFETNYPEDRHLTDFVVLWNTYKRIAEDYSPDEREWVFEKAANAYRQVVALDPENPVKWKPSVAYCFRRAGKTVEAVMAYEELIKDDAKMPDR